MLIDDGDGREVCAIHDLEDVDQIRRNVAGDQVAICSQSQSFYRVTKHLRFCWHLKSQIFSVPCDGRLKICSGERTTFMRKMMSRVGDNIYSRELE
jgi:hypothetical protein